MEGSSPKKFAIIVAGGTGTRMQSTVPKQFMSIAGKPILVHTLLRFHQWSSDVGIILVMHADWIDEWKALAQTYCPDVPHRIVAGGKERFDSVLAGLDSITESNAIVGIHDAVRPLVSSDTLQRCYEGALEYGSAIPCVPVTDSIRMVKHNSSEHMDRRILRAVQTPQCFEMSMLKKAYQQQFRSVFTDDASVVEAAGFEIHLVEGNRENIKITNPEDMLVANSLLGRF
jgi:2-C-methyl-D-erythritol 4-phosphate cytidylyltransferase